MGPFIQIEQCLKAILYPGTISQSTTYLKIGSTNITMSSVYFSGHPLLADLNPIEHVLNVFSWTQRNLGHEGAAIMLCDHVHMNQESQGIILTPCGIHVIKN